MLFQKILYYLIRLKAIIFLPFVIIYLALAAYTAYILEPNTFTSYLNSLYWVLTTLATVGFGDYAPKSDLGKVFTISLYITGIGLISVFIGKVIKSISHIENLRIGGIMNYTGKNHIILIGWSDKSRLAVQEILSSDKKTDIVIIDTIDKAPLIDERVFYVRGNAAVEATLMNANLPKAKGVIIFSDQVTHENSLTRDPLLVDGKTLLIATAITSIEERMDIPIYVTAEVMDTKHIDLFKHVKVDEFVPAQEIISHAAVRSLYSHGITRMYAELLSRQCEEGIYEISKKQGWVTYRDAFQDLLNNGATLVADRGDLHINQKLDEAIPHDSRLFVICDKETISRIKQGCF